MAIAWSKLSKGFTVQERVDLVAEKINSLCWQLLSGEDVGGMECFQKTLLDIMDKSGLSEKDVLIDVSLVGVHPDSVSWYKLGMSETKPNCWFAKSLVANLENSGGASTTRLLSNRTDFCRLRAQVL
jgi:hypothetical protein